MQRKIKYLFLCNETVGSEVSDMQASKPGKKCLISAAVQAACYSMLIISPTQASPVGGQVVGGGGAITQSGANTTINQTTQNMAINWQSYNLNANERVQYIQPNVSSLSLNRILSNNGSIIAGRIDANGKVILVNPNGIFFTSTAVINVGSIIASGLDIQPTDFMNGHYIFNEVLGTDGAVINSGILNASLGGNVALIGRQVENNGLISAHLGTVTLAAGKEAVLTFDEAGLLGVRVSKAILQSELGINPAVLNSGTIEATGGKVLLTASVSKDVFSQAVNTNGIQQATSVVVNADGTFTLGDGADVVNTGSIDTSTTTATQQVGRIVLVGENVTSSGTLKADAANGTGGEIELHAKSMTLLTQNSVTSARSESNGTGGIVKVLGDKVGLFDQSTVDVSGSHGGGQALIGGDLHGANALIHNASATLVDRTVRIYADALQQGDGGNVIVWADGNTQFFGNIFTRGGALFGNGGFVETSGKQNLLFDGMADRTAVHGQSGVLLLDPNTIYIAASQVTNTDLITSTSNPAFPTNRTLAFNFDGTNDITITPTTLVSALGLGAVVLQANVDINVNSSVTSSAANTSSLTLEAHNNVNINNRINLGYGNLLAKANNNITTNTAGVITTNGSVTLISDADTSGAGDISLSANVTAGNGFYAGGVNFDSTSFQITAGGPIYNVTIDTGTSGNAAITMTGDVSLGGVKVGGNLDVTAGATAGTGILQGTVNATNDILSVTGISSFTSLRSNRSITLTNNNTLQGLINITTTDTANPFTSNAALTNTAATTTLGAIDVKGTFTVNAARDLAVINTAVTSTGNMVLNFGSQGTGGYTFCYHTGVACADATTTTGPTISATAGNMLITGGVGANTFNLAGLTFAAAPTAGTVTVDGTLGTDTLVGQNSTSTWAINTTNTGTLSNANGAVNFTGVESLRGGSGNDTFTVNALNTTTLPAITIANITTGDGINIVNVNANGAVTGMITTGSNTNTVNINGTVAALDGTTSNGANTITVAAGGSVSGNITTGTGVDVFNLTGAVNGVIIGGGGAQDSMTIITPGNVSVRLGNQRDTTATYTVDQVETITDTTVGSVNTLISPDITVNAWAIGTTLPTSAQGNTITYGLNSTTFANFASIQGGNHTPAGSEQFTIYAVSAPSGSNSITNLSTGNGATALTVHANATISGALTTGTGSNTLDISGTVGVITGAAAGANTITVYSGGTTGNLTFGTNAAGDGMDRITVNSGGTTGTITTGAANDVIVVNGSAGAISVRDGNDAITLGGAGVVASVEGGAGADALRVSAPGNTWTFTTDTNGSVSNSTASTRFVSIETYTDGAAGSNTGILDLSGLTTFIKSLDTVTGFSTIIGNNDGITTTGSSTLIGRANTTNTWQIGTFTAPATLPATITIDGLNDGTVTYGATTINFINVSHLVGGAGTAANPSMNNVTITATGGFAGAIDGGGANSTNTLAARDIANIWTMDAAGGGNVRYRIPANGSNGAQNITTNFIGMQSLVGALTYADDVTMNAGGSIAALDTGHGNNTVTVNAGGSITALSLGNGDDVISINAGGLMGTMSTGDGADQITIAGAVTGLVDGGAGAADRVDITTSAYPTIQIGTLASATPGVITITNIEQLHAYGVGTNTLQGPDTAATQTTYFSVTGNRLGSVSDSLTTPTWSTTFHNIDTLTGGNGPNTLYVNNGGTITNVTAGNGGNTITVNAGGVVNGAITTGSGDDSVTLNGEIRTAFNILVTPAARVGSISTGVGNDTVTLNAAASVATIELGAGDDTLYVNGAGKAGQTITVNGNEGNDQFTIGTVAGSLIIDGGAGTDTIGSTLDGFSMTVFDTTSIAGVTSTNIEGVNAINGTLNAPTSAVELTWAITGQNAGTVSATGFPSMSFRGFTNLNGNASPDHFVVSSAGSIDGVVNGTGGANDLSVALTGTQIGQINYVGNGSDLITLTSGSGATGDYTTTYTPVVTLGVANATGNFAQLTAGNGLSNYSLNVQNVASLSDTLSTTLLVNAATPSADSVLLNTGRLSVNGLTPLTYGSPLLNLSILSLASNDTVSVQSPVSVAGMVQFSGGTITNAVSGNTPAITADTIGFDRITSAGTSTQRLTLAVNNLRALGDANTGTLYLDNTLTTPLTLVQLTEVNLLDLVSQGSITGSALNSRAILSLQTPGTIRLAGNLTGNLTLTGLNNANTTGRAASVSLVNTGRTQLAGVRATNLDITGTGDIVGPSNIVVSGITTLASDGVITLSDASGNRSNDFSVVNVTRASALSIDDINSLAGGDITANTITLRTATGITNVTTHTAAVDIINTAGSITLSNTGATEIRALQTHGDILFTNTGGDTVLHPDSVNAYTGDVTLITNPASIYGYGALSPLSPDITAHNLSVTTMNFGTFARPINLRVDGRFTNYVFGQGFIHYYLGLPPADTQTLANVLSASSGSNALSFQQLIDVEALSAVDPAIFTEVRNYFYEDVAIKMPLDQNFLEDEDNEQQKKKKRQGMDTVKPP
jgi:filamentous hemagglutinin family protein